MGVIARPCPHRNFDGRILLERVSKHQVTTKLSAHTKFSNDLHTCELIKAGDWKELFDDSTALSSNEILSVLATHYCLEESIVDRLELSVVTYIGNEGNTKDLKLEGNGNILNQVIEIQVTKTYLLLQ